jgi:hypothetical protein
VFLPALSAFHHLPSDMMDHVRPRPGCDRLRFMASSVPGARRRPQPPSCRARRRRHRDTRNTATTRQRPPPSRDFGIETRRHGKILKQETSLWSTVWGSGIIEESTLRETLPHIVRDTLAMEVFCSLMQPRDPGTLRIVPDFTCCNAILDCFYSTYYSVACNASLLVFSASHLLIVFTWPRLPSVYSPIKQDWIVYCVFRFVGAEKISQRRGYPTGQYLWPTEQENLRIWQNQRNACLGV